MIMVGFVRLEMLPWTILFAAIVLGTLGGIGWVIEKLVAQVRYRQWLQERTSPSGDRVLLPGNDGAWFRAVLADEDAAADARAAEAQLQELAFDVWLALGGHGAQFPVWWSADGRTSADGWAQLLAAVRNDVEALRADTNPPAGMLLDLLLAPTMGGE